MAKRAKKIPTGLFYPATLTLRFVSGGTEEILDGRRRPSRGYFKDESGQFLGRSKER